MNLLCNLFEVLVFGILFCCSGARANNKTLLCYFETDVLKSSDPNRYLVEDIDTNLCTHLVYTRIKFDFQNNDIIKVSEVLKQGKGNEKIIELKTKNPKLKILVSLEPILSGSDIKKLKDLVRLDALVVKTVEFIQQYKFDGVIFKMYPLRKEEIHFYNLVESLNRNFVPHKYVIAFEDQLDWATNVNDEEMYYSAFHSRVYSKLVQDIDFVVLDTFNFFDFEKNSNRSDHHTPLYNQPWDKENKSVDSVVNRWISEGFPPNKILLGISLWGRTWKYTSMDHNPPTPADGPGVRGKYTMQDGLLGYFEICEDIKKKSWKVVQDPGKTMGPYAFSDDDDATWVSYDDPAMAAIKSEYIIFKGLGGAAVKDISYDDFENKCGDGHNPMLTTIRKTLTPGWIPKMNATSSTTSLIPSLFTIVIVLSLPKYFKVV